MDDLIIGDVIDWPEPEDESAGDSVSTARERFLQSAAETEWDRLVSTVVQSLKDLPVECRQSGNDSPLENVWQEYCSQIQGEESIFFEAYQQIVSGICQSQIDLLAAVSIVLLFAFSEGFVDAVFSDEVSVLEPGTVDLWLLYDELHQRVRGAAADEVLPNYPVDFD